MRPTLWVSRCLMGDRVRYDGGHKADPRIAALARITTVIPVCPEVEAGLGVPRPPIDLVGDRIVDRAADRDVTDRLDAAIDARLGRPRPDAFIGKARSPSCGHGTARRVEPAGLADGRFVARLKARWGDLPIRDVEALDLEFLVAVWRAAGVQPGALLALADADPALWRPGSVRLAIDRRSERELLAGGDGGAAVRRRTTEDPT